MKSFKEFIKESTVPYNVWGPKKYEGAYGKGSFDRKLFDEIKKGYNFKRLGIKPYGISRSNMLFLKDSSKNIYKIRLGYHDNIIVGDLHSEFTTEFKPRMNTSSYVDDPYSFFNALIDVNEKEIYEGLVEIQKKFSGEGIPKVYVIKIPNVNKRTGNTGFNYNFYEEFDDSSYELYELEDYGISLIAAKGTDLKVGQEIFVVNNERPGYDAFSNGKLYAPYKIKKVLKPTELDTSRVGSIKFID